jgi:peroxiredoxin
MAIEIGQPAPAFSLKDQHGDVVSLSDFAAKQPVALVFYPFTFSGRCEGELCALRDDYSEFEEAGVQVLAVSCDSRFAQAQWAEQHGYPFPVLSDFWPHGEVARAYGVFDEALGCATRATFVIGADGIVVDRFETPGIGTSREKGQYTAALEKL